MKKSPRDVSAYMTQRRNAMLSMGFCPECSRYNDLFPQKYCSRCKQEKKARYVNAK